MSEQPINQRQTYLDTNQCRYARQLNIPDQGPLRLLYQSMNQSNVNIAVKCTEQCQNSSQYVSMCDMSMYQ